MALQIRRGTEANRQAMSPALTEGELAYVTNHEIAEVSPLWIGDGSTPGGVPVAPVLTVNSKVGTVQLYTDDITESESPTNLWFTEDLAQDAAAALFTNTTTGLTSHTGISFAYNDSSGKIVATVPTTVNSGNANSLSYYASTGAVVSGATDLEWNNSSKVLTINSGRLVLTSTVYPVAQITLGSAYNGADSNSFRFTRSRGTTSSPTGVILGDRLGDFDWYAHDGSANRLASSISSYVIKSVSSSVIPTNIGFYNTDSTGYYRQSLRILDTGKVIVGPGAATEVDGSGNYATGQILITSTTNPQTDFFNNSALAITQFFDGTDCQNISMLRSRGTWASPLKVAQNDELGEIAFYGRDTNSLTSSVLAAQITATVEGSVSSGVVPGGLVFQVRNTASAQIQVLKITAPTSSTSVGQVAVSGTISTTSTPGTFWNYDSSGSKVLSMTIGQTVDFAGFSGSVLVNCFNSGTVTQYLVGGGAGSVAAIGSSKVSPTGTMAYNSGISGYTFTATETGDHSFYVVRTRTGA